MDDEMQQAQSDLMKAMEQRLSRIERALRFLATEAGHLERIDSILKAAPRVPWKK